jgi:hypothetical protein
VFIFKPSCTHISKRSQNLGEVIEERAAAPVTVAALWRACFKKM